MAANFPDSPSTNDTFTSGALTFTWNGTAWKLDPSSGTKGEKGQKGEVGVTGNTGDKGQKGEVGDKGQKGEIGATGGSGGTGDKGQKGEVGATGSGGAGGDKGQKGEASTIAGDKGQKGEVGATGSGGAGGDKGQKGEVGDKGQKGEIGATGSTGDKGDKGAPSTVAGDKGQKGEIGATGSGGSTGSSGDKGQKGEDGPQGGGAPVGQIIAWSGSSSSLPSGYFLCDGSAISRTTYAALYTIVGTTHGAGNGSSTFNLPDLRDRFVVGASNSTGDTTYPGVSPGATGGAATDTVTISGSDTVNISVSGSTGFEQLQSGGTFVSTGSLNRRHTHTFSGSGSDTVNISGSDTVSTIPPFYALAYIIQYAQGGTTAKGQKGEVGATGSGGAGGDKGQKGEVGDKGTASSVQGPTGDKGQKGEVGATGGTGGTGSTGTKGQKGEIGAGGSSGSDGSDGDKGQKGDPSTTAGDKGQKGEVGAQGSAATSPMKICKHIRQTSNYNIPTGNTSWGQAGNMTMSFTIPANCMIFYNYSVSFQQMSTNAFATRFRGRVLKNGSLSHYWLPEENISGAGYNVQSRSAEYKNEGINSSTLYSANDSITIDIQIRNADTGTGNRTQINSGSYLTVFVIEQS